MSDLISRSKVIDILEKEKSLRCSYDADIAIFSIEKWIRELPTDYDIDKVVAELEKQRDIIFQNTGSEIRTVRANAWNKIDILNRAIEIVKQGGVSDDVCEWHKVKSNIYKCYTHAETYDSRVLDWCVCPYCGKKIKVVE